MNRGKIWRRTVLVICLVQWLSLCGCGQSAQSAAGTEGSTSLLQTYSIPKLRQARFHADRAEKTDAVSVDFSALKEGYVAIAVTCEKKLKFQVLCKENTYNYDLEHDGTPAVYPLNMGNGRYQFRVMENVSGDKYAQLWSESKEVTLADEFQPFLRPSQMVSYQENSHCVALARQLAEKCATDVEVVSAVYDYLVEQIRYDQEKADTVEQGYLPDPDRTLEEGKGICFDYAALAAAMLRSVGIPCKLVTGYVGADAFYHAWNTIYLEHQGWITVEIKVSVDDWNRIDTTFAAEGSNLDEDQLTYTTRYCY